MQTVEFEGKTYTKASEVAKRFKYTTDYIGQLCRAGKVDARLVGRAWYVYVPSIKEHRNTRYQTTNKPEEVAKSNSELKNYAKRVVVEPILNKKVVHILKKNERTGVTESVPVRYETDDHSLIPEVQKNTVEKRLPVTPAGARKVRVKKRVRKSTYFKTTPVPVVSLKGKLSIEDIPDKELEEVGAESEETTKGEQNLVQTSRENVEKHSHIGNDGEVEKTTQKNAELESKHVKVRVKEKAEIVPTKKQSVPRKATSVTPVKRLQKTDLRIKKASKKTTGSVFPILYAILAGMFISAIVLGLASETTVDGNLFQTKTSFDVKNVPLSVE